MIGLLSSFIQHAIDSRQELHDTPRANEASIEIAKKIADELEVTVDYLLGGSDKMILDKKTVKRMEEIEGLPVKEKEKILDYIDLVIRDVKIKKAHAA